MRGLTNGHIMNAGAGNDTLTRDDGNNRLYGLGGNDLYVIDENDSVVELASDGIDTVRRLQLYPGGRRQCRAHLPDGRFRRCRQRQQCV